MQHQRKRGHAVPRTVNRVAGDRPALRGAVHAQLVGAPGQRGKLQPGLPGGLPGCAPQHPPAGLRELAQRIHFHPPATRRVEPPQRQVNQALVSLRPAIDERPIGFRNPALLEQCPEFFGSLVVAAQHQAAGGVLVQPVRKHRAARQAKAQRLKMRLKIVATLGAAMHGNARRLVNDKHQPVTIEEARV